MGTIQTGRCAGSARDIGATIKQLDRHVRLERRLVRAGDVLYSAGMRFTSLHIPDSGFFKVMNLTVDGYEQVVGLHLRGDWLGLDGIAERRYGCSAIALDVGEIWSLRYADLLAASEREPAVLSPVLEAMSHRICRDHELMRALEKLPADIRVADFLHGWAGLLAERGLRTDSIILPLTRTEIGSYLGLTLESVSRAFSKLERADVIRIDSRYRRNIEIPKLSALSGFARGNGARSVH